MFKNIFNKLIVIFLTLGCHSIKNNVQIPKTEIETNTFCSKHKTLEAKYKEVHLIVPNDFKPSNDEVLWRSSDKDLKLSIKIDNDVTSNLENYSSYRGEKLEEENYELVFGNNIVTHDAKIGTLFIGQRVNNFIVQVIVVTKNKGYIISCESQHHKDSELLEECGKILSSLVIE